VLRAPYFSRTSWIFTTAARQSTRKSNTNENRCKVRRPGVSEHKAKGKMNGVTLYAPSTVCGGAKCPGRAFVCICSRPGGEQSFITKKRRNTGTLRPVASPKEQWGSRPPPCRDLCEPAIVRSIRAIPLSLTSPPATGFALVVSGLTSIRLAGTHMREHLLQPSLRRSL